MNKDENGYECTLLNCDSMSNASVREFDRTTVSCNDCRTVRIRRLLSHMGSIYLSKVLCTVQHHLCLLHEQIQPSDCTLLWVVTTYLRFNNT